MKIKIQEGKGGWRWAFIARNGKQTANNETHPTKAKAIRAAKGVVYSVIQHWAAVPKISKYVVAWDAVDRCDGSTVLSYRMPNGNEF